MIMDNDMANKFDEMVEVFGAEGLLDALIRALDYDTVKAALEYIDRVNDTGIFNKEEQE